MSRKRNGKRAGIARNDESALKLKAERNATIARVAILPDLRHAAVTRKFANPMVGDTESEWTDTVTALAEETTAVANGDLRRLSKVLMAQALTLDTVFTQLTDRAANNMGRHIDATDRYLRLALRAQANSRATMEAIMRLHQPREQIVKHVHVNQGGQAIVAEQVNYGGRAPDGNAAEQSHAQSSRGPALPGPDSNGNGVPITSGQGQASLSDARREEPRRADRQ